MGGHISYRYEII